MGEPAAKPDPNVAGDYGTIESDEDVNLGSITYEIYSTLQPDGTYKVTAKEGELNPNTNYTNQISGSINEVASGDGMTSFVLVTRVSNSPQQLGPSVGPVSIPSVSIGTTGTATFRTTVTVHNETGRLVMGSGVDYKPVFPMSNSGADITRTWSSAVFSRNPAISNNHIYLKQSFTEPQLIGRK